MTPKNAFVSSPAHRDTSLQAIQSLYNNSLYLQAYALAQNLGPLNSWHGTSARILAGRLAFRLGGYRLGTAQHFMAWRQDRASLDAFYYYVQSLWHRQGIYAAWKCLRNAPEFVEESPSIRSHYLGLEASLSAEFRDFDHALKQIENAIARCEADPWLKVLQAEILERADRYDEALTAAQEALTLQDNYRPAILRTAHLLRLQNRDEQAIAILESVQNLESVEITEIYADLQLELGHAAIAQQAYAKCLELSPLADSHQQAYWIAKTADAAYKAGKIAEAKSWVQKISAQYDQNTFVQSMMTLSDSGRRVLLPVDFMRQHHMTCAPATMATLMRFWGTERSQIAIADTICYGGTASHHSRAWLEEQNWSATEFTVTWENTQQLIDRGIPFAISTVEPNNSHMQAVIGYDSCVQWLLIRDPFERDLQESWAKGFFERYESTGPTGLLLLPPGQAHLIEDLTLDDSELYTQLYRIRQALDRHQRQQAETICGQMCRESPSHRLVIQALMAIASYDQDQPRLLQYVNQMLEQFPESAVWQLKKSHYLEELESRDHHLKFLRDVSLQDSAHPIFWQEYAQLLSQDQRQIVESMKWLKKAVFCLPTEPQNYSLLAQLTASQGDYALALELHRFAACLEETNAGYAKAYFAAAQKLNRTAQVIELLEQRWQRYCSNNARSVYPLAWAYQQLNRLTEMFEVLAKTQACHQEDDALKLYRARLYAEYGDYAQAESLVAQAKTNASQMDWWSTQAEIAQYQGHKAESLELWRKIFQANPMSTNAAQAIAKLLSETQGQEAAGQFLQSASGAFPYCFSLFYLWYQAEKARNIEDAIAILRQWVKLNPANAWAQRELAWQLAEQKQVEEAIPILQIARELEPQSPELPKAESVVYVAQNNIEAAKAALKQSLAININSQWAIETLLSHCHSTHSQTEALAYIEGEMIRQVISDEAISAYYDAARDILDNQALLESLRRAFQARPDLWKTGAVLVQHLMTMQSLSEALDLAVKATQTFPLKSEVWLTLAQVYEVQGNSQEEIRAYEQAVKLSPGSSDAIRHLSEAYDRAGEYDQSKQLLEAAIAYDPLDCRNYGYLAQNRWRAQDPDLALEMLQKAIQRSPNYEWAWHALEQLPWSEEQGKQVIEFIRDLTQAMPGEESYWYHLAKNLNYPQDFEEQIAALNQALSLNPYYLDAVRSKVILLKLNQDYEAALALCQDKCWGDTIPVELRGLAISVEAARGNEEQAIDQMKTLLETETDFYWGWKELARWYQQNEDWSNYLLTAHALTQHFPKDSLGWALMGDAQENLEETQEAKKLYLKALAIDPSYPSVSRSLFDLQLADGEIEEASTTLAQLKEDGKDEYYFVRAIQLAFAQGQQSEALQIFERLCLYPSNNDWAIEASAQILLKKPLEKEILRILKRSLSNPNAHVDVGRCWVLYFLQHWMLRKTLKAMRRLPMNTQAERNAHQYFLRLLITQEQKDGLKKYRKSANKKLHSNNETWGILGHYDAYYGLHRTSLKWYQDWDQRENLESWMVQPLVDIHISQAKYQEAIQTSQAILERCIDPEAFHPIYIAYCLAFTGDVATALETLDGIEIESFSPKHQFFYYLTQALCMTQHESDSQGAIALIKQAAEIFPGYLSQDVTRNCYRLVAWKAARRDNSIKALLWAFIRGCRVNLEAESKVTFEGVLMLILGLGVGLYIPLMEAVMKDGSCDTGDRVCQIRE